MLPLVKSLLIENLINTILVCEQTTFWHDAYISTQFVLPISISNIVRDYIYTKKKSLLYQNQLLNAYK